MEGRGEDYSFKCISRLALDQDRDVCESASQIISCQISGARPYSRSDQGLPPSYGSVSDSLTRPALGSHGRTCEEEKQKHKDVIFVQTTLDEKSLADASHRHKQSQKSHHRSCVHGLSLGGEWGGSDDEGRRRRRRFSVFRFTQAFDYECKYVDQHSQEQDACHYGYDYDPPGDRVLINQTRFR
ncbi:hypothetical protein INR49_029815, partial [Caranx melampygus]